MQVVQFSGHFPMPKTLSPEKQQALANVISDKMHEIYSPAPGYWASNSTRIITDDNGRCHLLSGDDSFFTTAILALFKDKMR